MRCHARLTLVLGVLFLLSATLADAQEAKDKKKETSPNYYPLEPGNAWYYRVTANGNDAKISTRIAKHEKINDEVLARLESPNANVTEHLTQTDKGVFRHRHNGIEVTPPFRLLPYPVKLGMKWEGDFVVGKGPGKHKYFGEIQKEETVEVPAGKFKTLRVFIKLEENGMVIETTYWFAQGVGFVKQSFDGPGLSVLLELEKVERKK